MCRLRRPDYRPAPFQFSPPEQSYTHLLESLSGDITPAEAAELFQAEYAAAHPRPRFGLCRLRRNKTQGTHDLRHLLPEDNPRPTPALPGPAQLSQVEQFMAARIRAMIEHWLDGAKSPKPPA